AGEPHTTHFHQEVKTFSIALEPQWAERLQQFSTLLKTPAAYESGLPIWLATRLYREFQKRDSVTPLMLEGMLLELLAQMARDTTVKSEQHGPRWLRQAQDYLHAHFTENLPLDAIAVAVGVHPAHLTRSFRQHFHCTLGEYVRRLRIE